MKRSHLVRPIAVAAAVVFSLAAARAADELPKAETILDKYVDVTGGKAAYEKHHSQITKGTIEITAAGLKGTVTTYNGEAGKSYMEIELAGLGKTTEGSDGKVYWMNSAMMGPHIKDGAEKAQSMLARLNAELEWRDLFKSAKTTGTDTVDGKECYKVELTPTEGGPLTQCYDKQSNLMVKMTMTLQSPMGEQTVESFFTDYRKEGDVLAPHKITQSVAGQNVVFTVDNVTFNTDIPAEKFVLPDEIKALLNKK